MTTPRDPRKDPKAGDIVAAGPQWQHENYHVSGRLGESVWYRYGSSIDVEIYMPLWRWRELMSRAEVIHAAD